MVLTANTFAGVVYQWQKNSIDIAGGTNQNYTASTQGNYRVKETANGCYKQSGTVSITVNCREASAGLSEEGIGLREVNVKPNPFKDEIEVEGEFTVGDRIELVDVLGKTIMNYPITQTTNTKKLETQNIKAGVYFLQIITSTQKKTVKVVRE